MDGIVRKDVQGGAAYCITARRRSDEENWQDLYAGGVWIAGPNGESILFISCGHEAPTDIGRNYCRACQRLKRLQIRVLDGPPPCPLRIRPRLYKAGGSPG